jgi:large subunit ribosomal protein L4e
MFAPTKTWRKWHRKINVNQRRYALTSALAASALPSLVLARGHKVESIPEVPLVVDNKLVDTVDKASRAVALLKGLGAYTDVEKAKSSKKIRSGVGKMRNRRHTQRRGPLIVYNEKSSAVKAFRNLPGVELVSVTRLNLLQLAPGGHLGRFCIWTRDAFEKLDSIYGTYRKASTQKSNYQLPRPLMANPDLKRIINSDEIQSVLREKVPRQKVHLHRKNPLKNRLFRVRLNPHAKTVTRREVLAEQTRAQKKAALVEAKRTGKAPTEAEKAAAKKKNVAHAKVAKTNAAFKKVLLSKQ